jgi:hypothetical protein
MGMSDEPRCIQQCIRRRPQNVRRAQRVFGKRAINVSGSFAEIFAPNLFRFDKRLRGFTRFKIFSDPLPVDIVSGDFESVLSVSAFTNYSQRVRSLAFYFVGAEKARPCAYCRLFIRIGTIT